VTCGRNDRVHGSAQGLAVLVSEEAVDVVAPEGLRHVEVLPLGRLLVAALVRLRVGHAREPVHEPAEHERPVLVRQVQEELLAGGAFSCALGSLGRRVVTVRRVASLGRVGSLGSTGCIGPGWHRVDRGEEGLTSLLRRRADIDHRPYLVHADPPVEGGRERGGKVFQEPLRGTGRPDQLPGQDLQVRDDLLERAGTRRCGCARLCQHHPVYPRRSLPTQCRRHGNGIERAFHLLDGVEICG